MKRERIKDLINQLNKYRDFYYNRNTNLISDEEYDKLFDELERLENETGIIYANSPTQTVGYDVVSELKKVKHNHPLLSLGKTTDFKEFVKYFGNRPFVIMQKLDGLTISLRYVNGKLVSGETRGNGEIGEDITHNVRVFSNIPLEIPIEGELIIDGEAIIDKKTFDEINGEIRDYNQRLFDSYEKTNTPGEDRFGYKKEFKNQRNLASGTVRQLDSKICAERSIKFIAWNLDTIKLTDEDKKIWFANMLDENLHNSRLEFLEDLGFEVCANALIDTDELSIEDKRSIAEMVKDVSNSKGTPIDGLVGRFNSLHFGESLGMTGHHPKHSLAFKFYQDRNETTFREIEWSTSRNNVINPVAVFDPVEIDGTTVNRATLNNISQIKKLMLGYDDTILVIKANQIIPQITDNLTKSGTVEIPKHCPDCGAETYIRKDGISEFLYCSNKNCKGAVIDRLVNFCGREGMNIRGLSEERIKFLFDNGYIGRDFSDIYKLCLYETKLKKEDGFGKSSVNKLLEAIRESKKRPLANVLVAIGIPFVGKSTAKVIAKKCSNSPNKFLSLAQSRFDWSKLPDIGEATSEKINEYVNENYEDFKTFFGKLIQVEEEEEGRNIFGGKAFCITGKLVSYKNREELVKDIERFGGKVVSGVTSKTSYLITNNKDEQTSKTKNAKKFGTQIINEEDFKNMIK